MARARVTVGKGMDAYVAQHFAAPAVREITEAGARESKQLAPPTKEWRNQGDGLVRRTHVLAGGQIVPSNLRFDLETHEWDLQHRGLGPRTYLDAPKDTSDGRVVVNIRNCRCYLRWDAQGVARHVHEYDVEVDGATVTGGWYAEGALVAQAEDGDQYPGNLLAPGTYFMRKSAAKVIAARRARR